ncbi:hypothetical protein BASA81_001493 [Batrachochytrium salamandrivorans]|nr:hypothetical protein BASA81_001493 [Batrachochytrium salamandrivorans]
MERFGNDEEGELYEVFCAFARFGTGSLEQSLVLMDSKQLQKLCRDCDLLARNKLSPVDVDLIFIQVKSPGLCRIDFADFMQCLDHFAHRRQIPLEALLDLVRCSPGPRLNSVATPDFKTFSSPLRESPAKLASSSCLQLCDWYEVQNPQPMGPDELVARPVGSALLTPPPPRSTDPEMFTGTQRYKAKHGSPTKLALQREFRGHTNTNTDEVFADAQSLFRRSWC